MALGDAPFSAIVGEKELDRQKEPA